MIDTCPSGHQDGPKKRYLEVTIVQPTTYKRHYENFKKLIRRITYFENWWRRNLCEAQCDTHNYNFYIFFFLLFGSFVLILHALNFEKLRIVRNVIIRRKLYELRIIGHVYIKFYLVHKSVSAMMIFCLVTGKTFFDRNKRFNGGSIFCKRISSNKQYLVKVITVIGRSNSIFWSTEAGNK